MTHEAINEERTDASSDSWQTSRSTLAIELGLKDMLGKGASYLRQTAQMNWLPFGSCRQWSLQEHFRMPCSCRLCMFMAFVAPEWNCSHPKH